MDRIKSGYKKLKFSIRFLLKGETWFGEEPFITRTASRMIPISVANRNHPYQKYVAWQMSRKKIRLENWVRKVLTINRDILHRPMDI